MRCIMSKAVFSRLGTSHREVTVHGIKTVAGLRRYMREEEEKEDGISPFLFSFVRHPFDRCVL